MAVTITLGGVDRSSIITMKSINKKDAINNRVDTLSFDILYSSTQTFRPTPSVEVIMTDGSDRIFGGRVNAVSASSLSNGTVMYHVECIDYSYDLDRVLVNEEYANMTVDAVIADILTNYTTGFTDTNVNCGLMITKVVFDRVTVTAAIQQLAQFTGYSWYIDYYKDIHFFHTTSELAPFNITDDNGKVIDGTLDVSTDMSQIRNRVFIKGGEIVGSSRTETFNGDGVKMSFVLANHFSTVPTVTVGGVSKTVGIDYLDNEADFNCFWDFNQNYIRFKSDTIPASGTNNISVTGLPLYNLVVQVEEPDSIAQYGIFEYSLVDKTLKSREQAVSLAKSQLLAYQMGLIEGGFETYEPGLRSGQVIYITSTLLDKDEGFIIQSVGMKILSNSRKVYTVKLATLRSNSLVQFLIDMLSAGDKLIEDKGTVVVEKTVFPLETISIVETIDINTNDYPAPETVGIADSATVQALDYALTFVAGPYAPTGTARVFTLDGSLLV